MTGTGVSSHKRGTFGPRRFGEHKLHDRLHAVGTADLRAGDILVAKEWKVHNLESLAIPFAQMVLSHHRGASGASEHVLLVTDDGIDLVAQAIDGGISVDRGINQRDHLVYSCTDERLRWEAAEAASRLGGVRLGEDNTEAFERGESVIKFRHTLATPGVLLRRQKLGAGGVARLDTIYNAVYGDESLAGVRMVCSEFVVSCFEVAARRLNTTCFNVDPRGVSAKSLEALLRTNTHFKLAGSYYGTVPYRKGQFGAAPDIQVSAPIPRT